MLSIMIKILAIMAIISWVFGLYFLYQNDFTMALICWSFPAGFGAGEGVNTLFFGECCD
jgi:hypothetical protein